MCDRGRIASGAGTLNPGGLWGPGWDSLPSISKRRTREGPVGGQIELWLAVGVRVWVWPVSNQGENRA